VRRYQTEIVIPADRTIVLQLPDDMPEGNATLVVSIGETEDHDRSPERDDDLSDLLDVQDEDIEWWEEFEDVAP
jgi:hypothetical protein